MELYGYDFLVDTEDEGVRYAWFLEGDDRKNYVESASFYSHRKGAIDNISGYTTSVSSGCILSSMRCPCRFCRTGTMLPFRRLLTAKEIAMQNVLMVLADMTLHHDVSSNAAKREFAYMGQGEPGYSYPQVRMAIAITNRVMEMINQNVYRHIISTSGVPEMITAFLQDWQSKFYTSNVTLHFSLHLTDRRSYLMPINSIYPYKEVLGHLNKVKKITGEKPCIGVLLFPNFSPNNFNTAYNSDINSIINILNILSPEKVRLSFCELNDSPDIGVSSNYPKEVAMEVLNIAKSMGFEAKLFSSFGKKGNSACGMLGGKEPSFLVCKSEYKELEKEAVRLVDEASAMFDCNY